MRNSFNNNSPKVKCKDCNSTNLKKRKNFSHGSCSKAKTTYTCKDCNSTNIHNEETNKRRFRRR